MLLELLGVLLLLAAPLVFLYCLYVTRKVKNKLGRFASSIDAESFAFSNNIILKLSHSGTRNHITQFGPKDVTNCTILLYYNDNKKTFSPGGNHRTGYEYTDYFYESLESITKRDRNDIISDVRWYFINNFYKMSSFYQIMFDIWPLKPCLPFIAQDIVSEPETVLSYLPDHLKISAKLSLMEIDSLRGWRIKQLHSQAKKHTDNEKKSEKKLVILRRLFSNHNHRLTLDETKVLGEDFIHSLHTTGNPIQFIESQIEQINLEFLKLGSAKLGKCKLHALGVKLIDLFAADFAVVHNHNNQSDRLVFYLKQGKLYYYTTLFFHQYKVLKFARKIGNICEEKLFLECFNVAKYQNTHGTDKTEFLCNLLKRKGNLFSLKAYQFILNNQPMMHSLLL